MEKANYSSEDIKLKLEGLNLNIDKEVLDDQRALEVSTEVPDKEKVSKDDKVDFENFKVLYANAIKDKCLEEFGVADDDKLLEDTAKEMYLASKTYIPEEDKKADGELEKKTESVRQDLIDANIEDLTTEGGEDWIVFYLGDKELCSYTFNGTFDGELPETRKGLAAEYGVKPEDIKVKAITKKTESKKLNETETKQSLYDEISRVLTDYENNDADNDELYKTLVKVQNRWEDTITACESKSLKEEVEENPFKIKYKAMLNGKEVKPGDKIKDFRGDEHIFKGITNPGTPFGGRNGKVQVDFGDGSSVEYYPSVFNIELVRVDESKKVTESIDEEELNDTYSYIQEADELAEKLYDTWNSIPDDIREILSAQYTGEGITNDITFIKDAMRDFASDWVNVRADILTQLDESKSVKKECPKQS